jgi:hypothetical protein
MDELVPKYKIGDIVQLNSGGYKMTINAVMKHNSLQNLFLNLLDIMNVVILMI